MLDALELLHYGMRFCKERFSIVVGPGASLEQIELDLRVLEAAGVEVFLFCNATEALRQHVSKSYERGLKLSVLEHSGLGALPTFSLSTSPGANAGIVRTYLLDPKDSLFEFLSEHQILRSCAGLNVRKVLIVSPYKGLCINERFISHITPQDLEEMQDVGAATNVPAELLDLLVSESIRKEAEVILLSDTPGDLYQEIFTHHGRGTLFSQQYENCIRPAKLADTHQIALLLRPASQSSSVLPLTEDQIAAEIDRHSVYTVNGEIIAHAKLTPYGDMVELGKFATLPRYQGKGRARELAQYLIERAVSEGFQGIFALTTQERMGRFFLSLGFDEIAREGLPREWSARYDLSRPSRAYLMKLTSS